MCNNTNKCGCEPICGCQQPCSCPCPCQPTPCDEGCLTDTKTDCVFLSSDLDICSEVLPKGSTVTEALTKLGEAVCDGVTVTVQDMKVKVDANDTTSGYLFDKLTVCNNLEKTVTNINGNETLQLCTKIDTVTGAGNNILTSGPNGLYIPPFTSTGYNLTPLFSDSILLTINPVLGGQSILATVKKDTISGGGNNILQIGANGLYVPPPTTVTQTVVTKTNIPNSGIESFVSVSGNIYTISSKIKLDPSSTAPISLTANGLKVDCCIPVTPANTPIVITPDPSLVFTASGIDSHTLFAKVKVDTTSGGNALVSGPNGLYCPTPGAASPTSIIDSPTIDATLINPTTYSLAVVPSLDSCNAVTTGSDGGVYVNGVSEPYGLYFYTDGTDLKLGFKGPSTNPSDYIVELQGTTGNPSLWIPGSFQILDGDTLIYDVASTSVCARINARVKYVCGVNESDWVGESYTILPTFVSEDGSISITGSSSGICNEINLQLGSTVCTNDFTGFAQIIKRGGNYFVSVVRPSIITNNSDVFSIEIHNTTTSDIVGGGTITEELLVLIPISSYSSQDTYQILAKKHCTFSNLPSTVVTIAITNNNPCGYSSWLNYPDTALVGGIVLLQTYTSVNLTNPTFRLKYKINNDNSISLNGVLRVDLSGPVPTADTGWKNLLDLSLLQGICSSFPSHIDYMHSSLDHTSGFDFTNDVYPGQSVSGFLGGVIMRRSGNFVQYRAYNASGGSGYIIFNNITIM